VGGLVTPGGLEIEFETVPSGYLNDRLQQPAVFQGQPIAADGFVAAKLTLDELIRTILSLTNLYPVL
jgi:hypothetical protein